MAFLEWSQGCVCIWALESQVPHAGNSTWRRAPDRVLWLWASPCPLASVFPSVNGRARSWPLSSEIPEPSPQLPAGQPPLGGVTSALSAGWGGVVSCGSALGSQDKTKWGQASPGELPFQLPIGAHVNLTISLGMRRYD